MQKVSSLMIHWVRNTPPIIVSGYISVFLQFSHFVSIKFRKGRSQMSFKIKFFKNIVIFTPVLESLCDKVAGL